MFTDTNLQHICDLVEDQFPAFYKEQGPGLIDFITAYYEWLEQPENPLGESRSRYKQFDIDTASAEFLDHYRKKYMWGMPPELLGNQRLLQKHILELYRTKGSQQATRLLFRLLYNEDIEFYIPSYDIFKLSDNTWIQPNYLEVTFSSEFPTLVGNAITGVDSGATAIVESYESRHINGLVSYLLFVSNVTGVFKAGEKVTNGIMELSVAPIIKGSVVGIQVTGSSPGMNIGELLTATVGDKPVKAIVSDTYDGTGSLRFIIEKPGTYYSLDATFKVKNGAHEDRLLPVVDEDIDASAYGFEKDPLADLDAVIGDSIYNLQSGDNIIDDLIPITGDGAEIRILSLKDTFTYQYNSDMVEDFLLTDLDGLFPFPALPTSNLNTIVSSSLEYQNIIVGSIDQVLVVNPGVNYTSNTWFQPIDPYTSGSGIKDANNEFVGTNGLIIGVPIVGDNIVRSVKVHSSGYNNIDYAQLSFTADSDNDLTLTGMPVVGGLGWDVGYYDNTKSFLSDDKYLFDGHYYQDFSYVIRAARTLDKYIEILKQISHPAGNAVYGDVAITAGNQLYNKAIYGAVRKRVEPDMVELDFISGQIEYRNKRAGIVETVGPIDPTGALSRLSSATYFDKTGVMQTAGPDQIRYDHDPVTKQPKGILIEKTSTNMLTRSGNLMVSPWNPTRMGRSVGPVRRGMQFTKLTPTTDLAVSHQITNNISFTALTADTLITVSFYVYYEGLETTRFSIRCHDSLGFLVYINYDIPTLRALGGNNLHYGSIVDVGDGIAKVTASFTARTGATGTGFQFFASSPDGSSTTTWNFNGTDSYYIACPQLETGTATSYIETAATQATRASDNFVLPLSIFGWDINQGTLACDFEWPDMITSSAIYSIGVSTNTTTTNYLGIRRLNTSDQAIIFPGTSSSRSISFDRQRVSMGWNEGTMRSSRNGDVVSTIDRSSGFANPLTVLRLGSLTTSTGFRASQIWIRSAYLSPDVSTDQQLRELSIIV